jgi:RHS repeat-associated protein
VFIEERNNTWNTPYSFNAKELDEETGLYYYGARYYDALISLWLSADPLQEKYPNVSTYAYTFQNPVKYIDPTGNEPILPQAGTIGGFVNSFNNTRTRMGTLVGNSAHDAMMRLGKTEFNWSQMRPMPMTTNPINVFPDKYIYTEKGGWIDMAHFMFYAGKAYDYKNQKIRAKEALAKIAGLPKHVKDRMGNTGMSGIEYKANMDPVGKAVQDGYRQEMSDRIAAEHSAYSYEDLPSDKFGADFGANYFDPNSKLSLGEQLQNYFIQVLGATTPEKAPNFDDLPENDERRPPSRTNHTTKPVFVKENP